MNPVRVLLADDHTLVRAGFRQLLAGMAGVEVVAEAKDGREALGLIEAHQPDVVFLDIAMPKLNGLEVTTRISRDFPEIRLLILSMHANEEYVLRALNAGAAGYLLKDADTAELELAIKAVVDGKSYLSPAISKHLIDYITRMGGSPTVQDPLTPRQREILQLIAEGHTTRQIAEIMHLSMKTIESHRSQLMDRLDIHDIAGLVRYAIRTGVISSDR